MSDPDARALLANAQAQLRRHELNAADVTFAHAAATFAGPTQLLGGGHGWRGRAQVAIHLGQVQVATRSLDTAERMYKLGRHLADTGELAVSFTEAIATCRVMAADLALRQNDFANARKAIDSAYPLYQGLGERPSTADLWSTTARLAEREGRWFAARTAWERVIKIRRGHHDEPGTCDGLIRLTEAQLADGEMEGARVHAAEAHDLAKELDVPSLVGRVHVVQARLLELEHDWDAAWEKWLDALSTLEGREPILRGLTLVRMARTAARLRPAEAPDLLQRGFIALDEGHYPDAVGLVLHQLAVVSLVLSNFETALLAATGAREARQDSSVDGVLFRCLTRFERIEAAWLLAVLRTARHPEDPDHQRAVDWLSALLADRDPVSMPDPADREAVRTAFRAELFEAVRPLLRSSTLSFDTLQTRQAVIELCSASTELVASTPEVALQPVLLWTIREGEQERHVLQEGMNLLGRGPDNAVRMAWDALASRTHCGLDYQGRDALFVSDLNSQHGVHLNEVPITEPTKVMHGDHLRVGETDFIVRWEAAARTAVVAIPVS